MNPAPQAQAAPDARLAGGMMNIIQQLQRNRLTGSMQPVLSSAEKGAEVLNTIRNNRPDGQEQDAARTPGALQEQRSQERGRQRDVGQGETQSRFGQGTQVQRTKERQQQQGMR
jgi:hypothetical protein